MCRMLAGLNLPAAQVWTPAHKLDMLQRDQAWRCGCGLLVTSPVRESKSLSSHVAPARQTTATRLRRHYVQIWVDPARGVAMASCSPPGVLNQVVVVVQKAVALECVEQLLRHGGVDVLDPVCEEVRRQRVRVRRQQRVFDALYI